MCSFTGSELKADLMKKVYFLFLILFIDCVGFSQSPNTWVQKTPLGGLGRAGSSSFTIGTKAYITGGCCTLADLWEWDQSSDTWTQKANAIWPFESAVGFSIGTKGYIATGYIGGFD